MSLLCALVHFTQRIRSRLAAKPLLAILLALAGGLVAGLLMTGILIRGRSTLFTVVTCISLPLLAVLEEKTRKVFIAAAMVVALAIGGVVIKSHVLGDAPDNVSITYNLLVRGVYSNKGVADPAVSVAYSSFREPVLPLTMLPFAAAALADLDGKVGYDDLLNRLFVHPYLKGATVLWSAILLLGLWKFAVSRGAPLAGWLAMSFSFVYLCRENIGVMLTEIPAAALFVWLAYFLTRGIGEGAKRWYVAAGVTAALLALTKLLFLYVFAGTLPFLVLLLARKKALGAVNSLRLGLVSAASFSLVMAVYVAASIAWHPGIGVGDVLGSGRSNDVLATRALKNFMTPDERLGSLFAYSRGSINTVVGLVLGVDKTAMDRGGRWERLSRGSDRTGLDGGDKWYQDAHSYYVMSKDETVIANARSLIRDNLGLHLAMSPIFLYRGLFGLATGSLGLLLFIYCAARFFLSAWKGSALELSVLWFPLAMIGAYAVSSHFIPRYAIPMSPLLEVWFLIRVSGAVQERIGHRCPQGGNPSGA